LNVTPAKRLHEPRWRPIGRRRQQQVNVVGHQHVGVNRTAAIASRLSGSVPILPVTSGAILLVQPENLTAKARRREDRKGNNGLIVLGHSPDG
jgi:hypothetical protein